MAFELPLFMQNNDYEGRLDRLMFALLWDEGVMDLASLKVTERALGTNFTVDVSAGDCVITGDDQTNQYNYVGRNTAAITGTSIGAAPSGLNQRYDIVCARVNDPDAGGNSGDNITIVVTAGTPATSPAVPAVPASSLLLAVIGPITSSTSSITNSIIHDCSTGTGPTEAASARLVAGRRATPGEIVFQSAASPLVPSGWLLCAGQAISRTTYARLFAHLGTTYGVGNGTTTFNVPDLRGRVPVGLDNMGGSDASRLTASNTLGGSGGAETHTLSSSEIPAHVHTMDHDHASVNVTAAGSPVPVGGTQAVAGSDVSAIGSGINLVVDLPNYTGNTGSIGSGAAHNNLQPYLLLNAIIRT